ncbi:MAG: ribulokinase [Ruminococcaceae bacterium]|nr:ribulokinase [Oscillospiraceae bacterium]
MSDTKYTIGIDYGTLSGRALLVRVSDGCEIGSAVLDYPHAVMDEYLDTGDGKIKLPPDWALEHPRDFLDVLSTTVPKVLAENNVSAEDVIGVGIDFTACTILPTYADGTPLCFTEKFRRNPHAYTILWKHHAAQPYATRMNELAVERGEKWLGCYGGKVSSEWLFPKVWQILSEAPEVYTEADTFIEAGDWVIWQLTGEKTRNTCALGYKSNYTDEGFPTADFLRALDPRLENIVAEKLTGTIVPIGSPAGYISEKGAELTGLKPGTPIAACVIDAHAAVPAAKVASPGKMLAIMGTSTCHMLVSSSNRPVPGICGIVKDGMIPGTYGFEAGQVCVGDHFAWLAENLAPAEYKKAAEEAGQPLLPFMIAKAAEQKPGEGGILALDWWNGNRSVLADSDLSGLFIGMSLNTKAEELLRALIEATAFGTRMIVENYRENGVAVDEFYACGGIAVKDPFTMQVYADILGMDVKVTDAKQGPALGSAIYGALAAGKKGGGYDSIDEASAVMGKEPAAVYHPIAENKAVYDKLYAEYKLLHDYFGRGGNDVMKRLRSIKNDVHFGK